MESLVKCDRSLGYAPIEAQSKEKFRRHPFEHQSWRVLESEFPVVLRMPDETATSGM